MAALSSRHNQKLINVFGHQTPTRRPKASTVYSDPRPNVRQYERSIRYTVVGAIGVVLILVITSLGQPRPNSGQPWRAGNFPPTYNVPLTFLNISSLSKSQCTSLFARLHLSIRCSDAVDLRGHRLFNGDVARIFYNHVSQSRRLRVTSRSDMCGL